MKQFFICLAFLAMLFAPMSSSSQVIDLRTGVNSGGIMSTGSADDTWTVLVPGSSTYQAALCGTGVSTGPVIPYAYLAGLSSSVKWITPYIDGIGNHLYTAPMGYYYYKMTFDYQEGCLAKEATFNFDLIGADDQINQISVNGHPYVVAYGFNAFSTNVSLSINPNDIQPGINEIVFAVYNYGNIVEPYSQTGMEVDGNLTIISGPDASFCINTATSSGLSVTANSSGGTHEWKIYSSPTGNVGSYTYLGNSTDPSCYYTGGPCWLIKHTLTNDCGTACVAQSACYQLCESSVTEGCSELTPPTNLVYDGSTNVLSWAPVSGAVSYTIQLIINDPACCNDGNGSPGILFTVSVTGNSFVVNVAALAALGVIGDPSCFSWSVTAVCADGITAKSEKKCAFPRAVKGPRSPVAPTGVLDTKTDITNMVKMYPNPTKGSVMIDFSAKSEVAFSVTINDMSGKTMKTFENLKTKDAKHSVKWNTESVSKGTYIIRIQTSDGQVVFKKLIVE